MRINLVYSHNNTDSPSTNIPQFTVEQIPQMEEFINYKGDFDTKVNMASMILYGSLRCISDLDWIVDSGMTYDSSLFTHSLENTSRTRMVHLPNGQTSLITHVGECTLSASLKLQ